MLTDTQLAYIAGIVDGEGSISLVRVKRVSRATGKAYRPETRGRIYGYHHSIVMSVDVGMTDKTIPEWLHCEFGGAFALHKAQKANWKDRWDWRVSSQKALTFLRLILPYLVIKKGQAELAISYQETRRIGLALSDVQKQADEILLRKCKGLNTRGKPLVVTNKEGRGKIRCNFSNL